MPKVELNISGGWAPDLPKGDLAEAKGLSQAKNVFPVTGGYEPVKTLTAYGSNADVPAERVMRGVEVQSGANDNFYSFLITKRHAYSLNRAALLDVTYASKTALDATYTDFCQYGNWLISTDFVDYPLIKKDLTSPDKFALLGGTPPKAKYCLLSHGHLIFAYLNYDGNTHSREIMWSGKELPESMSTSNKSVLATGADSQDFPDMNGVITGLVGLGDSFAILADRSITIGYYQGGAYRFGFKRNLIDGVGCFYPGTAISIGETCFFWSRDSIWRFSEAGGLEDVGMYLRQSIVKRINKRDASSIIATPWPEQTSVIWGFSYETETTNKIHHLLVYNYIEKKFTLIDLPCWAVMHGNVDGYPWVLLTEKNWDHADYSAKTWSQFDSGVPKALVVISDSGNAEEFEGDTFLEATLETGEVSDPQVLSCLNKAYIPFAGTTGSVSILHRKSEQETQTETSASSIKDDGSADALITNRRLAVKVTATDFTKIGNRIFVNLESAGEQ